MLEAMSLTVSDAFRIMLTRVAREKKLPFEPLIPNDENILAMNEARANKLEAFDSVDSLMADLKITRKQNDRNHTRDRRSNNYCRQH